MLLSHTVQIPSTLRQQPLGLHGQLEEGLPQDQLLLSAHSVLRIVALPMLQKTCFALSIGPPMDRNHLALIVTHRL